MIYYQGAPAELRDIPLGTHLHGTYFLPPKGEEETVKPTVGPPQYGSKYNHAILLEDDFSFFQRRGWSWRIGEIIHGDGGNPLLLHRMRAQSNFIENAPLVLILIGAIELTGKGGQWLAIVGAVFMLGRISHGLGMDSIKPTPLRGIGAFTAMLTQIGLAVIAVLIALGKF